MTISKTVQMPRTKRTVRIVKKMSSSKNLWPTNLTCICFVLTKLFNRAKFYYSAILYYLGVSIAINVYLRNIIVINTKVNHFVFTKSFTSEIYKMCFISHKPQPKNK